MIKYEPREPWLLPGFLAKQLHLLPAEPCELWLLPGFLAELLEPLTEPCELWLLPGFLAELLEPLAEPFEPSNYVNAYWNFCTFLLLDLLQKLPEGWSFTYALVKTSDFCNDGTGNFQKLSNIACNDWVSTMKFEAELNNKANPMMLNLAFFCAILFCLKLTRPPTPVIEVFAKILPMISKVTSKNFSQRNPILVFPWWRRDPKHKPMDDMMMGNPILVIVGLRRNPKHE